MESALASQCVLFRSISSKLCVFVLEVQREVAHSPLVCYDWLGLQHTPHSSHSGLSSISNARCYLSTTCAHLCPPVLVVSLAWRCPLQQCSIRYDMIHNDTSTDAHPDAWWWSDQPGRTESGLASCSASFACLSRHSLPISDYESQRKQARQASVISDLTLLTWPRCTITHSKVGNGSPIHSGNFSELRAVRCCSLERLTSSTCVANSATYIHI